MLGYDRDPRSIAQRAEAYLATTGIGDTAFFGPEPEFFIFDDIKWSVQMQGASYAIHVITSYSIHYTKLYDGGTGK